jgi:uncharacterized paraquat-inducible protein A
MKSGTGTVVCRDCHGIKREKDSERCAKCHRKSVNKLHHRDTMVNRRKKGEEGRPIRCGECGANVDVPPRGKIKCPRCGWVIA